MQIILKFFLYFILINIAFGLFTVFFTDHAVRADWRSASHEPLGIAPDPEIDREAVVQVYAARAYGWRGIFGVHTWIATKKENADTFISYEVIGWRARHGGNAITASRRAPDSRWFGSEPEILADLRGDEATKAIRQIEEAINKYPYSRNYTVWPGPNSNTFVAEIARDVPDLKLDLPPTAIGKDYIPGGIFGRTPSGTGFQVSLAGLLGVMVGVEEGLELNILGLTFGVDPKNLSLKLPMIGTIGPS